MTLNRVSEFPPMTVRKKEGTSSSDDATLTLENTGSSYPLVSLTSIATENVDTNEYNPFEHRNVENPTTDLETFWHFLKGCLGSGILAMPYAFKHAGLLFGLIAILIIGIICTYSVYILIKCSHTLCRKKQTPSMDLAEIAEAAFEFGPRRVQNFAKPFKVIVNLFIVLTMLGCCCAYVVFIAENMQKVLNVYDKGFDLRLNMLLITPILCAICLIRNLKYLAPFSMLSNILIILSIGITFWYVFQDLPSITSVSAVKSVADWPKFFGTAIFALEGIGVIMPLENNMKTPQHFIGCKSVLNFGMLFVVCSYTLVGFFGYMKYGDNTDVIITLNLPTSDLLAQSVNVMMIIAICFSYPLQFFVPIELMWGGIRHRSNSFPILGESLFRILFVFITVFFSILIPNLSSIISLVGALCLSTLGIILPSIIDISTNWVEPGLGIGFWNLHKNLIIIIFGIVGMITGVRCSIEEM